MDKTITSRTDLLLAKIAGKSVNLNTMTPPVAASVTEQLLLDIAERLDSVAGDATATATSEKAGIMKQAANVPEAAGEAPTAAEFKALLDALIAAGVMAAPASQG